MGGVGTGLRKMVLLTELGNMEQEAQKERMSFIFED